MSFRSKPSYCRLPVGLRVYVGFCLGRNVLRFITPVWRLLNRPLVFRFSITHHERAAKQPRPIAGLVVDPIVVWGVAECGVEPGHQRVVVLLENFRIVHRIDQINEPSTAARCVHHVRCFIDHIAGAKQIAEIIQRRQLAVPGVIKIEAADANVNS